MLVRKFQKNAVILIPQNGEWTKTAEMVREIAEVSGRKIRSVRALNLAVHVASKIPGKIGGWVNKAFGNMAFDFALSDYDGIIYRIANLKESVEATEKTTYRDFATKLANAAEQICENRCYNILSCNGNKFP